MRNSLLDPAVQKTLDIHKLEYEVIACDPKLADTAAFCAEYGYTLQESANTIVVASRKIEPVRYVLCVILATTKLDVNKTVCRELQVKRASFADAEITELMTGMKIGGVTAIGVSGLPIFIDSIVMQQDRVVMGGGNRSSKLILAPTELLKLPDVRVIVNLAN